MKRPCMFATSVTNAKGKIVKHYPHKNVKTPLECLFQLATNKLVEFKPGITLPALMMQARSQTDLAAAQSMQRAKNTLFASFTKSRRQA